MQINLSNKRLPKNSGTTSVKFVTLSEFLKFVENVDSNTIICTYDDSGMKQPVGFLILSDEIVIY